LATNSAFSAVALSMYEGMPAERSRDIAPLDNSRAICALLIVIPSAAACIAPHWAVIKTVSTPPVAAVCCHLLPSAPLLARLVQKATVARVIGVYPRRVTMTAASGRGTIVPTC